MIVSTGRCPRLLNIFIPFTGKQDDGIANLQNNTAIRITLASLQRRESYKIGSRGMLRFF